MTFDIIEYAYRAYDEEVAFKITDNAEFKIKDNEVNEVYEMIKKELPEEKQHLIDVLVDTYAELQDVYGKYDFRNGFMLGASMIMDIKNREI